MNVTNIKPAWVLILLSVGESELVEVYGHERDQERTRRQRLISSLPNQLVVTSRVPLGHRQLGQ